MLCRAMPGDQLVARGFMDEAAREIKIKIIQYVLKPMLGTSGLERRKVNRWLFGFTVSAFLWAAFGSLVSFAATQDVTVGTSGSLVFTPASVTINANDTVRWTWASVNHTSTSDTNGIWDTGLQNTGFVFTRMFSAAGTFPYH